MQFEQQDFQPYPQQYGQQYDQSQQYMQQPFQQYDSPQPIFATVIPAPVLVMQQAQAQQLGELRATYAPRFTNKKMLLAVIATLLFLDIAASTVLFTLLHFVNRFAFLLIVLPIVGIIYTADALSHHSYRVYLFTYGLVYVRGEKLDTLRWEQVSAVWHRLLRQTTGEITHRYTIQRYDGAPIKLGNIMGNVLVHTEELGSLIEHDVMQTLLSGVLSAYNAGQILSFGKLSLSLQGIARGTKMIPWTDVGTIETQKDQLVINKNGTIQKLVKASEVPNYPLFLQLVARATGQSWSPTA